MGWGEWELDTALVHCKDGEIAEIARLRVWRDCEPS